MASAAEVYGDSPVVDHLWAVLRDLAPGTEVLVDLDDRSFRSRRSAASLVGLCRRGPP